MKLVNGQLVMGKKDCQCGDGTQPRRIVCRECNGTGNGKRGGRGGCRKCNGLKIEWDSKNPMTCTRCNGNFKDAEDETTTDYMPNEIWDAMKFEVYRTNLPLTLNEALLGLGCIYSCEDYGAAFKNPDDAALIADVKNHKSHQACKFLKDGKFADHVGIIVKTGGYSVRAIFKD